MSYDDDGPSYTATEAATKRIRREASQTRAMTNALRNAGVGRQRSSGTGGSLVDGLIIGAMTLVFYGLYPLLRGLFLGLFYALRWGFRRIFSKTEQ